MESPWLCAPPVNVAPLRASPPPCRPPSNGAPCPVRLPFQGVEPPEEGGGALRIRPFADIFSSILIALFVSPTFGRVAPVPTPPRGLKRAAPVPRSPSHRRPHRVPFRRNYGKLYVAAPLVPVESWEHPPRALFFEGNVLAHAPRPSVPRPRGILDPSQNHASDPRGFPDDPPVVSRIGPAPGGAAASTSSSPSSSTALPAALSSRTTSWRPTRSVPPPFGFPPTHEVGSVRPFSSLLFHYI